MSNSTTGPPMALPPDTNREAALIGIWWFYSTLVIITLFLRFWARIRIHSIGWDDWFMLLSAALFIETSIMTTYYATLGGTRHLFWLTPEEAMKAIKFNWLAQPCAIFALFTSKASVALLILRLLGPNEKSRRYFLYFIIVTAFIVNAIGVVFTFVQCTPVQALWDHSIQFTCWDPQVQAHYNYFSGAWNVMVDIVLALIPTTFIVNLKMSTANKIRLSILLGLGLIASVFAAVKVYYLSTLTARADLTYITFDVMCWAGAELALIIICGSIPTMKPLYDHYWKGDGFSKWYASRGTNGYGSTRSWLPKAMGRSRSEKHAGETLNSNYSDSGIPLSGSTASEMKGITITKAYNVDSRSV